MSLNATLGEIRSVREELLIKTIEFAAKESPFYRDQLGPFLPRFSAAADLSLLPTTSKATLARHGLEMLTSTEFPARLGLTSGTTYEPGNLTPPAIYYRSQEEVDLTERLHNEIRQSVPQTAQQRLALQLIGTAHGSQPRGSPGVFQAPFERPFHFAAVLRLLTTSFRFENFGPRITTLISSLNRIKFLATLLDEQATSSWDDLALDTIVVYGSHLTPQWRDLLQKWFKSQVLNVYGLSEIPHSNSPQCPACGGFHLPPLVFPEIVSLNGDDAAPSNVGELVLTTLYPFTKLQPLIRYRTGDLARFLPRCSSATEPGVEILGRVVRSAIDEGRGIIVPSSLVHGVLDGLSELHRDLFPSLETFGIKRWLGTPRYRMRLGPNTAGLELETEANFDPRQFPLQGQELQSKIETALRQAMEQANLRLPKVDVRLVSKGALGRDTERFKP